MEYKNVSAIGFRKDDKFYLYDRYSNIVSQVPELLYFYLDDFLKLSVENIIEKYKDKASEQALEKLSAEIIRLQSEKNFLIPYSIPFFSMSPEKSTLEKVKEKISRQLTFLCINMTEACNLRCEYCVYSGKYTSTRSHNNQNVMDWKTAKKAVDFFLTHSTESQMRRIGFYGGEPLLNFNIIKEVINYSKNRCNNIIYTITTNGTLLNDDVLSYLVECDVKITISLDGPEEIHNSNRKYSDKAGSFDIVMRNIEHIRVKYPVYFNTKLSFSATLSPHENLTSKLLDFFTYKRFPSLAIAGNLSINWVNSADNSYYGEKKYDKWAEEYEEELLKLYKNIHIEGIDNLSELPPLLRSLPLHREMMYFHFRDNTPFDKYKFYWPNGTCIPGMRSIFLTKDGTFYPCEKLYDLNEMKIGNVNEGINLNYIESQFDDYSHEINKLCANCWAFRTCGECWTTAIKNDTISITEREKYCQSIKSYWVKNISNYIDIIEKNPNAFSYATLIEKPEFMSNMIND